VFTGLLPTLLPKKESGKVRLTPPSILNSTSFCCPKAEARRRAGQGETESEETAAPCDLEIDPPDNVSHFVPCPRADHWAVGIARSQSTPVPHDLPREAMSRTVSVAMPGKVVAAPARMATRGSGRSNGFGHSRKTEAFLKVNRHHGRLSPGIRPGRLASSIRRPVVLLLSQRPATRGNLLPKLLQHHSLKLSKIHEPPCSHGVSAPSAHWPEEATNTGLTSPGCAALTGFLNLSVLSSSP
jgi:hypothetical protein